MIQNKQSQRKFEYAKNFGVLDNYNPAHRNLFQRKWIEHMKSTHACLGTYKGEWSLLLLLLLVLSYIPIK